MLLAWQLASLHGLPDYVLSPFRIIGFFVEALGTRELYEHIGASLLRSLPGFVIGSVAGVVLGLAADVSRALDEMLSAPVFLSYPVPKIVMLPIFMLWFGIGDISKILVIALACFYPMFINAYYGARSTPGILVWTAQNMGAGRRRIWLRVVLPAAMPDGVTPGHVPFDSRTMKVLELTLREALALGHNYIGTEHILLGLLEEEESLGGGTLAGLGITKERAQDWLVPVLEQMAAAKRQSG